MRRVFLAIVFAAAAGRAAAPVSAQVPAEQVARSAEEQLRSPVTPSHTLDMCPSAEAAALRDTVLAEARAGRSVEQIVEGVIARRGEQMRIVPRESGVGLWAWVLPPSILVVGAGVVALRLAQLKRGRREIIPVAPAALSDDERAQVEAALRSFERGEAAG
ncbi:MAG TPA: cytochrome c-type biogenesis protein CcmH [Longimicrobiaceae bacterium]